MKGEKGKLKKGEIRKEKGERRKEKGERDMSWINNIQIISGGKYLATGRYRSTLMGLHFCFLIPAFAFLPSHFCFLLSPFSFLLSVCPKGEKAEQHAKHKKNNRPQGKRTFLITHPILKKNFSAALKATEGMQDTELR